jgi:hypothetical protein
MAIWIAEKDPRWSAASARMEKETGKRPRAHFSAYAGDSRGVFVRCDWVENIQGEDLVYLDGKKMKWAEARKVTG